MVSDLLPKWPVMALALESDHPTSPHQDTPLYGYSKMDRPLAGDVNELGLRLKVGLAVGDELGLLLVGELGLAVGGSVGGAVGLTVGDEVGLWLEVGLAVGDELGLLLVGELGLAVGGAVDELGLLLGAEVGLDEGSIDAMTDVEVDSVIVLSVALATFSSKALTNAVTLTLSQLLTQVFSVVTVAWDSTGPSCDPSSPSSSRLPPFVPMLKIVTVAVFR